MKTPETPLFKGRPLKILCFGQGKSGGRNSSGRITAARKGGGAKRLIRLIDHKRREFWGEPGEVMRIEKDPGRTGHIALLKYMIKEKAVYRYILSPAGLMIGTKVIGGDNAEPNIGNTMSLQRAPQGSIVHNVELYPGRGGQICRSAGASASITGRDGDFVILRLRSGELRRFRKECLCTIGEVSNKDHINDVIGKAGRSRWLGIRPSVRGIAKNPVDHPMGGRTNGGRIPCYPSGMPTRGLKTRSPKKLSDKMIIARRKKNS